MLSEAGRRRNYFGFLWHSILFSITLTFTDINSVMPAMILRVGGRELHIGIVSAIMIGMPLMAKLFFTGWIYGSRRKKPFLLTGIYLRVAALGLIAATLINIRHIDTGIIMVLIYAELLLFTVSGAFAGISYIDLIGKSFDENLRKKFFGRKQIISSAGILVSALAARFLLTRLGYPYNYFVLFAAASGILLIATAGFWILKEEPAEAAERKGYLETLGRIPAILKDDATLRTYLLFVNTIGFHTALTPFYVSYARQAYYLDEAVTGNLLLIKIVGMIASSLLWPRIIKHRGFKGILKIWAAVSAVLPFAAILVGRYLPMPLYLALFLATGLTTSAHMLTSDAVIIEISSDKNRVLYLGIVGVLSLSIALFPIALGGLIRAVGYLPVFFGVGAAAFAGRLLLNRLACPADAWPSNEPSRLFRRLGE